MPHGRAFASPISGKLSQVPDPQGGGFRDLALDRPASRANTLTFTVNLTKCLRSYELSFSPGQTERFSMQAFVPMTSGAAGIDNTATSLAFTRR